jgi:uncharacterized protein YqgC (DUF456 family)
MDTLIIIGALLAIIGVIGSIIPALPGPVLSYGALVLLYVVRGSAGITPLSLSVFGILLILVITLGYAAPIWGAQFSGASKRGLWGAAIGAFLGLIILPPLGLLLGTFLGAMLGELSTGKDGRAALKAGIGTLLGSVMIIALQTLLAVTMASYYFYALIRD